MALPARQSEPSVASDATGLTEIVPVRMAQSGDEEALVPLFERYNARIQLYLARMVGDDEVGYELAHGNYR